MNIKLLKYSYKILPKKVFFEKLKVKLINKIGLKYSYFYDFDFSIFNDDNFTISYDNGLFSEFLEDIYTHEDKLNLETQSKSIEIINNFCENKIYIFGYWIELKDPKSTDSNFYNFNTDFINNYSWSEKFKNGNIKSYKIIGNIGCDIKVPWEIGRLQFLTQITGIIKHDETLFNSNEIRYTKDFVVDKLFNFLVDFIVANPLGSGLQWISAMDVSIRLTNIIHTLSLLSDSDNSTIYQDKIKLIEKSIFEHIQFVFEHLEWSQGMRANHYYSNIAGLVITLNSLKIKNKKYKTKLLSLQKFAINELVSETYYQFNKDGSHFEDSLPYHFMQVEFLLFAMFSIENLKNQKSKIEINEFLNANLPKNRINSVDYLNNNSNEIFDEKFRNKLNEIYNFSKNVLNINNQIKQIGDNDSGRFVKFDNNDTSLDFNSRLELFDFILNKTEINSQTAKVNETESPFIQSQEFAFSDFGLYILKNENYEFYLKSSKIGQLGKGGHSHNDNLSFVMDILGEEIFVDNGTYSYTKNYKLRNTFRSTNYHNVLQLSDLNGKTLEQNELMERTLDDMFWLYSDKCNSNIKVFNSNIIIAENECYGAKYTRAFLFKSDTINCKELIEIEGIKQINFHLHPNVKVKSIDEKSILLSVNSIKNNVIINVVLQNLTKDINSELLIDDFDYSENYLQKVKSKKIILKSNENETNWSINFYTEKLID